MTLIKLRVSAFIPASFDKTRFPFPDPRVRVISSSLAVRKNINRGKGKGMEISGYNNKWRWGKYQVVHLIQPRKHFILSLFAFPRTTNEAAIVDPVEPDTVLKVIIILILSLK